LVWVKFNAQDSNVNTHSDYNYILKN
jgi:hypothetical protein